MRALAPTASAATTGCWAPHWAGAKQSQQAARATSAAPFSSQAGGEAPNPAGAKDDYGSAMRHAADLATQHEQVAPGEVGGWASQLAA
jgi:hypothetical protein